MKKATIIVLGFLITISIGAETTGGGSATDIPANDIQAFLKALPRDKVSDLPIRVVDAGGYHVAVYGVFRPKAIKQEANLHKTKVTEIYYILNGAGTLVTGGTIPDAKPMRPNSTTFQGVRIDGGITRRVSNGDVIIIPGNTPHWWSNLESDMTYLITRPDPESTIKLK